MCVTEQNSDIILLCDTRLNTNVQIAALNDLKKKLFIKGYDIYHNSYGSSRGVCILVSKKLNTKIVNTREDDDGNFILLNMEINDVKITVGAVYGPNQDELNFFENLKNEVTSIGNANIILGGDWNLTWDTSDVDLNMDVINMVNIPSRRRSLKLREIAEELNLQCPYRVLYPNKKEYTFIPSSENMQNRSRIDFFFTSDGVTEYVSRCEIPHCLKSNVFDHKEIRLDIGTPKKRYNQSIVNAILSEPDLDISVKLGVFECYLTHSIVGGDFTDEHRIEILSKIGRINENKETIRNLKLEWLGDINGDIPDPVAIIDGLQDRCRELIAELPELEFFENLTLTCNKDVFFEVLTMSVKTYALSFQNEFYRLRRESKKSTEERIKMLKRNFAANHREILQLERKLSNLMEGEMREKLSNFRAFEGLHSEKITPVFLKMAKGASKTDSLSDIDDEHFENEDDRNEYITQYYENVYKLDNIEVDTNRIHEFLGEEGNNEVVENAKLTDNERADLDRDLTVAELDKALARANQNSAPGIDGISTKFIKKFWTYFRNPLLGYSNQCFQGGNLTDSFRSAKIRLIPKKGDTKKLKNWRPISLLSCFYKILSRALTMRLRKYIDKLTPVGQKAYSETRQCQEIVIEILESIDDCKHRGVSGGILSLDISKAFDSVSHKYLESVLEFFNFGPNYIRWIKLIATNRQACIILEGSKLSRNFKLEKGNAQGDTISPLLFLLAFQILLFKIELHPQIVGVSEEARPEAPTPQVAREAIKVPREKKVFAFADDGNLIIKLTRENLLLVKNILNDFGSISGLKCNVEKTNVLAIGMDGNAEILLGDTGFNFTNNITVLGVEIGENFEDNYRKIQSKVQKQVNFWTRFNLSLPGRISIAKTMMYSQINYMGCFLNFNNAQLDALSNLITKFVGGKLNIAKQRFFKSPSEGGIGLFDMQIFLQAQKCSWVKRACIGSNNWKIKLQKAGTGTIFNQNPEKLLKGEFGILRGISEDFQKFAHAYWKRDNNFEKAHIVNNRLFTLNRVRQSVLTYSFFGELWPEKEVEINNLKFNMIWGGEGYRNFNEVREITGLQLTDQKIIGLRGLCDIANERFRKNNSDKDSSPITNFVMRIRKGSKKFRRLIVGDIINEITANVSKFAANVDVILPVNDSKILNSIWNVGYLSNQFRTFLFKLHNNSLGYNCVVSRFVRNIEPYCTFCQITRNPEMENETVLHLFFTCPEIEHLVLGYFSGYRLHNNEIRRRDYFGVIEDDNLNNSEKFGFLVVTALVKFYIWENKLRKCIPNQRDIHDYVESELDRMCEISSKMRNIFRPAINGLKRLVVQG